MLILDGASENKLEELVKVSEELNETIRESYPEVHKVIPDRGTLLWMAIDEEINRRKDKIDQIKEKKKGAEQEVLRRACRELKKEYELHNQLMEELYGEEILPATIPELLIGSVKRTTMEMKESNQTLQNIKGAAHV